MGFSLQLHLACAVRRLAARRTRAPRRRLLLHQRLRVLQVLALLVVLALRPRVPPQSGVAIGS